MPDPYRVAVVGCGIGRSHIVEGYQPQPDKFRVVALCDLDPARLGAVADEFGIERRILDFDAVLAMEDVDIVDVCTPPATHKRMVIAALKAGKHVVCEKPLVGSLRDVDEVMAVERGATGRLMPIFQYRYGDGAQKAKRILDAGLAGRPFVATAETHWKRTAAYYDNPWRGRWETELGGVLMTHAIHIHDLVTYFMGPVENLFARVATLVNDIEVEDCVSSSWRMANGALVTSSATLGAQTEISRLRFCFENVTFESGLSPYSPADEPWSIQPASPEVAARIEAVLSDHRPVGRRFTGQMADFHARLVAGEPAPVTSADARRALELVTAFYDSASSGRDVTLPIAADHPNYASWRPAA
ncbi:Gfo/Idh/MocA family oxidoreductase [Aurantimonas sp. MSK8Z-1]|uniref:Gfo/Idh/MocA family protein n=1 Tax=Mangrovibrevibacter kandeliae TaxID=2968473 RepID=UPI002117C9A6|nr:Gfo/Idh/MocA family oxidoreductase [Aurantimonas sp. MSK8Z-1]MCW4116006.1 Gfo/Idh/MocA family oxidoreductase [Aurantimonas sp. MSK8Z-1]